MTAQRYKCIVQYDGTSYVGYQVQPNGNSVQTEIEKALKKMSNGQIIPIQASGRTDSGVHALGQVIHFDYPAAIKPDHLLRALNSLLPDDILIKSVELIRRLFRDVKLRFTLIKVRLTGSLVLNRFIWFQRMNGVKRLS